MHLEKYIFNLDYFQIWANQHFNEMSIVDNVLKLYPVKGKSAMKALVEQFQLSFDPAKPEVTQVL